MEQGSASLEAPYDPVNEVEVEKSHDLNIVNAVINEVINTC